MRSIHLFITGILFLPFAITGKGEERRLTIWFDKPNPSEGVTYWSKGYGVTNATWESQTLPIGNGSIGANIAGAIARERITFNEKTLWMGGPNTSQGSEAYWNANKQSAHVLKDIREAFAEGDVEKATRLTRTNFNSNIPYEPSEDNPFRFGTFTTMGEFYIETGLSEAGISNYRRTLDLDSATVQVRFLKEGVSYSRHYFISYPDNVMAIRFEANQKGRQNLTFSYAPNPEAIGKMLPEGDDGLVYRAALKNNEMQYVIRIQAKAEGGSVSNTDGKLQVKGADAVIFYVTADTDYRMNFNPDFTDPKTYVGVNPDKTTDTWMRHAMHIGWSALLSNHHADYTKLFDRVKLSLNPRETDNQLPTPDRLKNYRNGKSDFGLEELYYQYGRYLLIASSRPGSMPANLQGIWHNNVDGPWHVDYHNNINIQMNYWPAGQTNLNECTLPLIDFIRSLVKPGEKTAQAYFGARGWTASISSNIFGFTAPLSSEDMSWNFNPMAGPWLATHVWDYYDYTRDVSFLRKTGYPLLKSSADFAVDYLWHKPDGTYTAAPSTSPEHGPVDQGATFVHAVIREILLDAIEASKILKKDEKERRQWEEILQKLAPYRIGRYGQLMEWSTDIDDPQDTHRHVNHLFGLHPGRTISPITTPQLAEASRVVLEHRGDFATGWSMGWKLNQWARLHDGNHAYKLFGNLLKNGTHDNLWDVHPPFQIDGNFGGTAGVTEMLLQSHTGEINLLPALPDAWREGSVKGLCARGNFEVDIKWKDGQLAEVTLLSKSGTFCRLRYKRETYGFRTKKGKTYHIIYNKGLKQQR